MRRIVAAVVVASATVIFASFLNSASGEGQTPEPIPQTVSVWSKAGAGNNFDQDLFVESEGRSVNITNTADISENSPSLAPDGASVVYSAASNDNADLYVIDIGGGKPSQLTSGPLYDTGPTWSPNGKTIAFERTGKDGHPEIEIVDVATGKVTPVTSNDYMEAQPAWSPDGSMLAWTRNASGLSDIVIADPDTGVQTIVSDNKGGIGDPVWSADSQSIYATRDVDGDGFVEIVQIRLDDESHDALVLAPDVGYEVVETQLLHTLDGDCVAFGALRDVAGAESLPPSLVNAPYEYVGCANVTTGQLYFLEGDRVGPFSIGQASH